jgi:NAD(P)-dependent dehydrogenase (short-subunit alcohol dehydrogenase family)
MPAEPILVSAWDQPEDQVRGEAGTVTTDLIDLGDHVQALRVVAGRTAGTLKETGRQVEAAGGKARFAECDVTDEQSVRAAVQAAAADSAGWTSA